MRSANFSYRDRSPVLARALAGISKLAAGVLVTAACHAGDFDCLIEPRQSVDIRAANEGLIARIPVDRGDMVKAGQVLVELDAGVERANAEAARYKAEMDSLIRTREVRVAFSTLKAQRREQLAADKSISEQDKDEAVADRRLAEAELAESRSNKKLAELEYRHAAEQLRLRTIRSPFDGVVVDRLQHPGDFADNRDARKPILKLADLSMLRVQVLLPSAAFNALKLGQMLDVMPEGSVGGTYAAKVTVIDRVFDAASGTFGIRLDLPNPAMKIPSGIKCRVRIDGVTESAGARPKPR
jgi:RND family efflux transporter MFP subunit